MTNVLGRVVMGCGLAGALALAAATPLSAQVIVVGPPYGGPGVYVGPYAGYAYAPGYRGSSAWDYPAGYDTGGMPYSYRDLGWQPGPYGAAPANPCYPSQRWQNRC
jgi:hypothetical protein